MFSRLLFWHIQTSDIVELIGPEKTIALLLENYSKYFNDFTWWLSGERSLPFGDRCPLGYLLFYLFNVNVLKRINEHLLKSKYQNWVLNY